MTGKAEHIIKELSPKFPEWTRNFRRFLESYYSDIYVTETAEREIWVSMEKIYASVLESMIRLSGIRDQWEGPEFLPLAVDAGMEVFYRANKLECPFYFGTDEHGFFLSTDLMYSEMLRKMDDRFWFQMAELTRFGELDLWENRAWPVSRARQEPWFHRKSKSRIFHLIRSAVAWEKEEGSADDLGMVIIRWKYDTPWEELLDKGSSAFRNLYRINESLWKKRY
jgi:hypothetical protein